MPTWTSQRMMTSQICHKLPNWTSHRKLPTPTSHRLPTSTWWPWSIMKKVCNINFVSTIFAFSKKKNAKKIIKSFGMLEYLVQKISDVPSLSTYQPTMSDFRPIMVNLPTYLKSDVINGRSLYISVLRLSRDVWCLLAPLYYPNSSEVV